MDLKEFKMFFANLILQMKSTEEDGNDDNKIEFSMSDDVVVARLCVSYLLASEYITEEESKEILKKIKETDDLDKNTNFEYEEVSVPDDLEEFCRFRAESLGYNCDDIGELDPIALWNLGFLD